jgi:hypothetical protein
LLGSPRGVGVFGRQRDGNDTEFARELLAKFEKMLMLHVADRDRLIEELSQEHSG